MTSSTFQILVPIDFSAQSVTAFYQSCRLATIYNAELTVLHAVEDIDSELLRYSVNSKEELTQKIDKKIKQFVEAEVAFPKKIVSCRIEYGNAANAIIQTLKQNPYNMIVIGFNEKNGNENKQIGSNALEVLKQASCQIVAVKNRVDGLDFKSIILPLDLSKPYTMKVQKTIELAKAWKGAVVNIISVLPVCDDLKVNFASNQLVSIVKEIEMNNIICNAEIIRKIKGEESMADIVTDYAQRVKSEMVMLITQNKIGAAKRLGSVTQNIMKSIEIPMFSIVPLMNQELNS